MSIVEEPFVFITRLEDEAEKERKEKASVSVIYLVQKSSYSC